MDDFIEKIKNIPLDKKQIKIISVVSLTICVFILILFVYRPLIVKTHSAAKELRVLEERLNAIRNIAKVKDGLRIKGRLLNRKEISMAIDEITKAGRVLSINFLAISPKEIEDVEGQDYQRMPVFMDLESTYQDLGLFWGSLEDLKESIVSVRSFQIYREDNILPRIKSRLVLELYLTGAKDGERR